MVNIINQTSQVNVTSKPNRSIDYIAIHYTAGTTSRKGVAKNTASYFAKGTVQASADFIVDDVDVVQYNPDLNNYYCWAVGDPRNKNSKGGSLNGIAKNSNSISIEMCSTNSCGQMTWPNDGRYSFTQAVINNTIDLVKYLMGKYGIPIDHVVRHYDITGKLCPGIIGWNAESGSEELWNIFKTQLGSDTGQVVPQPQAPSVANVSDESRIWDFLRGRGLSAIATAGVMGNLHAESVLNPKNLQNSFEKKLGMNDEEYTKAVDSGKYTNFVHDGAGYGLAQWTYFSRKQALLDYAKQRKSSIGDLYTQLDFMWQEMSGYLGLFEVLAKAKTIREASDAIMTGYEKPADQSEAAKQRRGLFAQQYYEKFATSVPDATATATPRSQFTVNIISDSVRIESEPAPKALCTGKGVFTIVEVVGDWGLLKSYKEGRNGWIYLKDAGVKR